MESLVELRAREEEVSREWQWLRDALNTVARVRAENGDAAAFRPMQAQAMRVGQRHELGWAATFLASPYARFISGHTLVVDGANWQRRTLTNPPVVTVRDQMGKGPFQP